MLRIRVLEIRAEKAIWVPVTLLGEYARAKHWNASFTSSFVTHSSCQSSVANSESEGVLLQANWDVGSDWQWSYRFDRVALNKDFPDDAYDHHGVGLGRNLACLCAGSFDLKRRIQVSPAKGKAPRRAPWMRRGPF